MNRRTLAVFTVAALGALSLPALGADDAKDTKHAALAQESAPAQQASQAQQPAQAEQDDAQEKVEGYTDTPMQPDEKWHVHDPNRPQPPVVTPAKQISQGADVASDAVVLV